VAASVGEGAQVVAAIHTLLAERGTKLAPPGRASAESANG
jgi:hypothetical protein